MAEERGLRVLSNDTTFFSKVSSTLTKLLTPTKIGINGMMINIKRSSVIKYFEQVKNAENITDVSKKDQLQNRYDESYTLYLESIDKYIMDSIYKKVKNHMASVFEKDALANYYNVVHLKDTEYLEYKYRKQKFLIDLDYDGLTANKKEKIVKKFEPIYVEKMDSIYKGVEGTEKYAKVLKEYEEYEKFSVGKLDEKDFLEKNMILLGLSRVLFTHSLPLVAAEQCYSKLLKDTRNLISTALTEEKQEAVYKLLLKLIEDYNVKLLSTKIYWDKPEERDAYKKFWDAYSKTKSSDQKEILSLKRELHDTADEYEKYAEVRKFYKNKLVALGAMRVVKGAPSREFNGHFIKKG